MVPETCTQGGAYDTREARAKSVLGDPLGFRPGVTLGYS
eukprot:COSAG06_NODE_46673_length_345_cov_0.658537_2_plen_38_part_01